MSLCITVEHVAKKIGACHLHDISFTVAQGEYFVILGQSGVGKTILLEMLAGLMRPDAGCIYVCGRDVTNIPAGRRGIGIAHQDRVLFPHMRVFDNIAYSLRCRKNPRMAIVRAVNEAAVLCGCENLLPRFPVTLSGGEAARVALARALVSRPACLVLDEPLSSLDAGARADVRAYLRRLNRAGQTIIHVTHEYQEALALAHRVAVMEAGRIAQVGTVQDVLIHPASEFAARFIGIKNIYRGSIEIRGTAVFCISDEGSISLRIAQTSARGRGCCIVRSEDVFLSKNPVATSAQNAFKGIVCDIEAVSSGYEICLDAGVRIAALVTPEAKERLGIIVGSPLWAGFKANAVQWVEE